MGKEIVINALTQQPTPRAPWVPFAGIHAGKLCGYNAIEVLTDETKLIESLRAVKRTYDPDGMPIIFDLQVEAEILGASLLWQEDTPPTVINHPFEGTQNINKIRIDSTMGRLSMIVNAMQTMKREVGRDTALYGLICGPLTLASHLRGTQLFFDMFEDKAYVHALLSYTKEVAFDMIDLYLEAGSDVIGVVDPMVSQISPDHFENLLFNIYQEIFAYIKRKQAYSAFFVCGDATRNLSLMAQTKPNCVSIDENIDIKEAKNIMDTHGVTIGGNIQLTITMLHGSPNDNRKAVLDILSACGDQSIVLSPGCDMPYDTPIENVIAISQAVRYPEEAKTLIKDYTKEEIDTSHIDIPDYATLPRPLVELFTLDSASCAACGYMFNVVNELKEEYPDGFDFIEYKFTLKENIARCVKMGVKNLPSIYINGTLYYSSIVPYKAKLKEHVDALRK